MNLKIKPMTIFFIIINIIVLLLQNIVATTIIFSIEAIILIILAIMNLSANSMVIERAKSPKNDIKDYLNNYGLAYQKSIDFIVYEQALGRNKRIISKSSIKKRVIYTIFFSLLLFVALNVFYCDSTLISVVCFLISLYFYLISKSSTVNEVIKRVKEKPDTLITTVISEDICSEEEIKESKKKLILSALTVPLAVLLFIGVNFESRYFTKATTDGYLISSYRAGVFEAKEVDIPEYIGEKKIVGIGKNAFSGNNRLEKMSMPNSVKIIEADAFKDCSSLKTVEFSSNIESIGAGAFAGCNWLSDVSIPSSLEKLGEQAFYECERIKSAIIPEGLTEIKAKTFEGCSSLSEIKFEGDVTAIRSGAFKNCSLLKEIILPDSLTILEGESFQGCKMLQSIVIPQGVTEIRGNTFEYCYSLKDVDLHNGIIDIHAYAFRECKSLKKISLPLNITEIHANTFENCKSLESIAIPEGVTRIAAHAFYGCSRLYYVSVPDTVKEIGSSAFRMCTSLEEIALPKGVLINERAFLESPTKIVDKNIFPDDVRAEMTKDLNELQLDVVYVLYDKNKGKEEVISPSNNNAVALSTDKSIKDDLPENLDVFAIEGSEELVKYLKKAKEKGMISIDLNFFSEAANEYMGEKKLVCATLDIDGIIKNNEEG